MNRSATSHATHDELLLARLYGDDVTPAERAMATAQITACPDCAAFFADLGAIATATRALPVPARPRDFTLSAADAARLRPRAGALAGWLGRTRALGTSLTAVGLAGVVLVGALSALPMLSITATAATPGNFSMAEATAAPAAPELGATGALTAGGPANSQPMTAAPVPMPAASAASAEGTASPEASSITEPSRASAAHSSPVAAGMPTDQSVPDSSPAGSGSGSIAYDTDGKAASSQPAQQRLPESGGANGPSGPDASLVALALFAAILLAGLLLLAMPRLAARRSRVAR